MSRNDRIFCFEALEGNDELLAATERLYMQTQHPDERIPWAWIARSIRGRSRWRPDGAWGRHLLVAAPEETVAAPDRLAGFAYGTHIGGYGGYVSYLGVADEYRLRGVGTRLFTQMFKLLAADAGAIDEPLPFVVWESHRPEAAAPEADWMLWDARVRLFDRAGGLWIDGLDLLTPNYGDDRESTVPLQLFVKPIDTPVSAFDAERLRGVARGLLERVYRMTPDESLYRATFANANSPRLRPALDAGRAKEPRKELAAV